MQLRSPISNGRIVKMTEETDWCSRSTPGPGGTDEEIGRGDRRATVPRLKFRGNGVQPVGRVVRSVRRKRRGGTSARRTGSRGKEANRHDRIPSPDRLTIAVVSGAARLTCQLFRSYLRVIGRCATCAMGMMGMLKWLRKDIIQRDRNAWNLSQKQCSLNNESYRNALQAFIDRRRVSDDAGIESPCSPDKKRADLLAKTINIKHDGRKPEVPKSLVPGVPHVLPSEIFEIGWVAGTEDRYLELIFAEWQNTRVSLKRHSHPDCKDAVKADLDVLSEIRHPNVLLLMATTFTDDHGLVSLFESVDCTLYHYIHDQGERISVQGIAKCGGRLSDALRHSHMRGYVHTAINSHCVYLASSGIVKLGGWELAMEINSPRPDRAYEERLRTEIFRWQAPELLRHHEPRKESDVYGLTLLIWEMCTMRVPWAGFSKADVERQYLHWKRGVIMDMYDFPPLLNNLLEAGLQLDVDKRTLDMNRMRRFLQRLEMQYEDEDPVYIDEYVNNNNEIGKTYILPTLKSPMGMKNKGAKLTKSVSAKQLYTAKKSDSPSRQCSYAKKAMSQQCGGNLKTTAHIEQINLFADDVKRNVKDDVQKNTNVLASVQNNYKKINYSNCNVEVAEVILNEDSNRDDVLQPWNNTYRKVRGPMSESRTASVYSSPIQESTDDESYKDARTNLKQLKKVLANRREHFFYGSDSSRATPETSPNNNDKVFIQVKSKDYEPHKPASHKTSLEPKYNKSPNQYEHVQVKPAFQQHRKVKFSRIPYLHAPDDIKGAIMQPRILNSNPQNFFEASLWRKEKLICLSKMRKACADESQCYMPHRADDAVSAETLSKDQTMETTSIHSDGTYIVKKKSTAADTETSQERYMQESEAANDCTEALSPQSRPLQVLKEALDRATKIVRAETPHTDESCPSPPFKTYENFDVPEDLGQACRSMFEDLYDIRASNDDDEIRPIEKTEGKGTFLFDRSNLDGAETSKEMEESSSNDVVVNSLDSAGYSYDQTYSRNFVCESIAEVSTEFNNSFGESRSEVRPEALDNQTVSIIDEYEKSVETARDQDRTGEQGDPETETQPLNREQEPRVINFNLMLLNDAAKSKDCRTCHQSTLPRRRSLPAALGQLRAINNSALGKLPIRRGEIPDSTVEDLYIDDEFGDSLNVNMVLLDEDLSNDEDFLPEIEEL